MFLSIPNHYISKHQSSLFFSLLHLVSFGKINKTEIKIISVKGEKYISLLYVNVQGPSPI